jgi:hypothetical protein
MRRDARDPYAPPPRHRDSSGALVRFAIVAALLGAAAWGYTQYARAPQTALVEPAAEEQTLADTAYDAAPPPAPAQPAESAPSAPATEPADEPPA